MRFGRNTQCLYVPSRGYACLAEWLINSKVTYTSYIEQRRLQQSATRPELPEVHNV